MNEETELKRLRWRCRRGMRELDVLMTRYLDHGWPQASEDERKVFLRLLDCEDDKLWQWFMGRERPTDKEIDALVQRITDMPC